MKNHYPPCRCDGSGMILAKKIKDDTVYGFRCGCGFSRDRKLAESIPEWNNSAHGSKYTTDFTQKKTDQKLAAANDKTLAEEECPF